MDIKSVIDSIGIRYSYSYKYDDNLNVYIAEIQDNLSCSKYFGYKENKKDVLEEAYISYLEYLLSYDSPFNYKYQKKEKISSLEYFISKNESDLKVKYIDEKVIPEILTNKKYYNEVIPNIIIKSNTVINYINGIERSTGYKVYLKDMSEVTTFPTVGVVLFDKVNSRYKYNLGFGFKFEECALKTIRKVIIDNYKWYNFRDDTEIFSNIQLFDFNNYIDEGDINFSEINIDKYFDEVSLYEVDGIYCIVDDLCSDPVQLSVNFLRNNLIYIRDMSETDRNKVVEILKNIDDEDILFKYSNVIPKEKSDLAYITKNILLLTESMVSGNKELQEEILLKLISEEQNSLQANYYKCLYLCLQLLSEKSMEDITCQLSDLFPNDLVRGVLLDIKEISNFYKECFNEKNYGEIEYIKSVRKNLEPFLNKLGAK